MSHGNRTCAIAKLKQPEELQDDDNNYDGTDDIDD